MVPARSTSLPVTPPVGMGGQHEQDVAPADVDVRVMVGVLGGDRDGVDQRDRRGEVRGDVTGCAGCRRRGSIPAGPRSAASMAASSSSVMPPRSTLHRRPSTRAGRPGPASTLRAARPPIGSAIMQVRELLVPGAFEFTPVQHGDDRGLFLEWFKIEKLVEAIGHPLDAGPGQPLGLQGRHPARRALRRRAARSGQVRHLPARRGASTTWWTSGSARRPSAPSTRCGWTPSTAARSTCPEGVGHAFLALEDHSTLTYLCSTGYAPGREHGITPVDPAARPAAAGRRRLPAVRQGHRRADARAGGGSPGCCRPGTPAGSTSPP